MSAQNESNRRQVYRFLRQAKDTWNISINKSLLKPENIVDLNGTGFCFGGYPPFPLKQGQLIEVQITLEPREEIICSGRVSWIKPSEVGEGNIFGIQFEKPPAWVESKIVASLQQNLLKERALGLPETAKPHRQRFHIPKWALIEILGVCALVLAIGVGLYFYGKLHPESSIELLFNQSLAHKMSLHF